jgi:hypothetical protein
VRPDVVHVRRWIAGERVYAEEKWTPTKVEDIGPEQADWVAMYIHRAHVLGLDTPLGRQNLAKALMTLTSFVEAAVRLHGPLPHPGVPSGEVRPFRTPTTEVLTRDAT